MKILKMVPQLVEIGKMDHTVILPTAPRIKAGTKTKCDHCGKEITDTRFVAGFKAGYPNMKFHAACFSE